MKARRHLLTASIGSVLAVSSGAVLAAASVGVDGPIRGSSNFDVEGGGYTGSCGTDDLCNYDNDRTIPAEILTNGHYDFPLDPGQCTPNGNVGDDDQTCSVPGDEDNLPEGNWMIYVPNASLNEGDLVTFSFTNGCYASDEAFLLAIEGDDGDDGNGNDFQPNIPSGSSLNSSDDDQEDIILAGTLTSPLPNDVSLGHVCQQQVTFRINADLNLDRGTRLVVSDEGIHATETSDSFDSALDDDNDGDIHQTINPVIMVNEGLSPGSEVTVSVTVELFLNADTAGNFSTAEATIVDIEDQFSASIDHVATSTIDVAAILINDNLAPGGKGTFNPIEDEDDTSASRKLFDDEGTNFSDQDFGNQGTNCSDSVDQLPGDVTDCFGSQDDTDLKRSAAELTLENHNNVDDYIHLDDGTRTQIEIVLTPDTGSLDAVAALNFPAAKGGEFDSSCADCEQESFIEFSSGNSNDSSYPFSASVTSKAGSTGFLTTGDCDFIGTDGLAGDLWPEWGSSTTDDVVIAVTGDDVIQPRNWDLEARVCVQGTDGTFGSETPIGTDDPRDRAHFDEDQMVGDPRSHEWTTNGFLLESTYVNRSPNFFNRFMFVNTGGDDVLITDITCYNSAGVITGPEFDANNPALSDDGSLPWTIPAQTQVTFGTDQLFSTESGENVNINNRAACSFVIFGNSEEVQATSQIIEPGVGAITDSPLLRPGTN